MTPLPCPKCGSTDLEVFANVVECMECDARGPVQDGPEMYCDRRVSIEEWNELCQRTNK